MGQFVSRYDDGSVLVQDDSMNVLGGIDVSGAQFGPAASNIGQQFMNLLDFGARAAIVSRYGTAATQPATYTTPAQQQSAVAQLMPVLLLAGAAFLVYKLAT